MSDGIFSMIGIRVVESKLMHPRQFGVYIDGTIYTHDARRLAANVINLGIDRKTGEVRLLEGKTAA